MDGLTKAFAASDRSYMACKQAVSQSAGALMAGSTGGMVSGEHFQANTDKQKLEALKSWTWVATRAIANRVAAQQYRVGRTRKASRGRKSLQDAAEDHPALKLLRDPNDITTGYAHLWLTVASLCLCGRSLWWVTRIDNENHLFYIPTSWLTGHTGVAGYTGFVVRPPGTGEAFTLPADECVLFSQPDPADPWKSVSPLSASVDAVNTDYDLQRSQRGTFSHGCFPATAVIVGRQPHPDAPGGGLRPHLSEPQRRQIVAAVRRRFEGPERTGGVVVLDGMIEKVERLSLLPTEMAYPELSKDVRDRILMSFGVSTYSVGGSEPGSRAASAVADSHFVRNVCRPIVALINSGLQEWFRPIVASGDEGLCVWLEPPEPQDAELAIRRMQLAAEAGVISENELRVFAGLPPEPAGGKRAKVYNPADEIIGAVVNEVNAICRENGL